MYFFYICSFKFFSRISACTSNECTSCIQATYAVFFFLYLDLHTLE